MSSNVVQSPTRVQVETPTRWFSLRFALVATTLGLLWFILCRDLSLEWSSNEQYAYGWFVPFFAAFLFWLRLEDRRNTDIGQLTTEIAKHRSSAFSLQLAALGLLAILAPVRLFEGANPDWRPLSWIHALAVVGLTLLLIGYWGGKKAVKHFAFPVCFILVAVPWLTPIEAPLVQSLMRIVAAVATETLTLFGIPAQLEGSLIRVNNGVVGVSEACSGVRSLQTSLMIGLLFGELKRLTVSRRFLLVGAALAIALGANFARALFLVWIAAAKDLAAVDRWHDLAGYALVGAVFVGTVAIASALGKGKRRAAEAGGQRPEASERRLEPGIPHFNFSVSVFSVSALLWLLLVEAGVSAWYRAHEKNLVPGRAWTAHWPESAPGFHELPIDDHTREMLRYDRGRQVSWAYTPFVRPGASDAGPAATTEAAGRAFLFFFRWEPGAATVLRARAHRPDICLPAVGWRPVGEPDLRSYPVADDFSLPFQHFSFIHAEPGRPPIYAETFFCLREDLVRPDAPGGSDAIPFSHWSIAERWEAVRNGMRNPGQQVMELVLMTRQPLSKAEAEAEFGRLVPKLVREEG